MPDSICFFASILEIITIYGLMSLLDRQNGLSFLRTVLLVLILATFTTLMNHFVVPYQFVFTFISTVLMYKILSGNRIRELILDITVSMGCYMILQLVASIGVGIFNKNILENYGVLFGMLFVFVLFVFSLGRSKKIAGFIDKYYLNNRGTTIWCAVNILFVIAIVLYFWKENNVEFWKMQWGILALVAVIYFLNINLLINLLSRKRQRMAIKIYQEYGEYMENLMHTLSSRQHEFSNQINTMIGIAQTKDKDIVADAIIEYGEQILERRKGRGVNTVICSDSIISALIFRKQKQAEDENIKFEYLIENPFPKFNLSVYDLMELLANLLNNAFEAVKNLEDDNREVFLKISKDKIEVINSISRSFDSDRISELGEIGYSTKGFQRGYGLHNIKSIVTRYSGKLEIYMLDQMINFTVLF